MHLKMYAAIACSIQFPYTLKHADLIPVTQFGLCSGCLKRNRGASLILNRLIKGGVQLAFLVYFTAFFLSLLCVLRAAAQSAKRPDIADQGHERGQDGRFGPVRAAIQSALQRSRLETRSARWALATDGC
jgi:hypothetical protein